MDGILMTDVLTGCAVAVAADGSSARVSEGGSRTRAASVFFPGCSMLNYAPALVSTLSDYLAQAGVVDGTSLLCCGKILDFEDDGAARRAAADEALRRAVEAAGTERIVAACPNCAAALKRALSTEAGAPGAEVVALPKVLAELGCRIDPATAREVLAAKGFAGKDAPKMWVHDSCPDRGDYDFGRGGRAMLPPEMLIEDNLEPSSRCCGSIARAAGRHEAALAQGARRAEHAARHGADAMVTACMSCAASLASAQDGLPVVHYLELLCDYPMDWRVAARPLSLRFLIENERKAPDGGRDFVLLPAREGEAR